MQVPLKRVSTELMVSKKHECLMTTGTQRELISITQPSAGAVIATQDKQ
jgi:hypothetical protein